MKNAELADMFSCIADMLEILGEDPFRVGSYRRAAVALVELNTPVENLAASGGLQDVPGIGKSMAGKIDEFLKTGHVAKYDDLLARVPPKLIGLTRLPGMGPKTAARLWRDASIDSVEQLREVLSNQPQRILCLKGMGEKKIQQMMASLAFVDGTGNRIRLGEADALAVALSAAMSSAGASRVIPAGSLRRGRETVGDIDLLCEASAGKAVALTAAFTKVPMVLRVLGQGDTKASVMLGKSVQADLRVVDPESFGSALMYFTGSKDHNVRLRELAIKKGWKLNEYGLFEGDGALAGRTEQEIYEKLGMPYIPPEIREDHGEIQAALEGRLPRLVGLEDIAGDFHMHTVASDGANTIDEMINAGRNLGYRVMAITDHSKSQHQANGLDEVRLQDHVAAIRKAATRYTDIVVLAGCEVDILKDGSLDFEPQTLAMLDIVVASPHAALTASREEATSRLIKAIENPYVDMIGHPTGRIVNTRPGLEVDIEAVARAAAKRGVALEINAHFARLDLRDSHVRAALELGASIVINSDAHSIAELNMMKYGVTTARRGWATKDNIVNCWSVQRLREWLNRPSRAGKLPG